MVLRWVMRKSCVTQRKSYQHVGIFVLGDAKLPNANGFASQWNIGFTPQAGSTMLVFVWLLPFNVKVIGHHPDNW